MFLMMTATYFLSFFNMQKEGLVSTEIFKRNWVRLKNIGLVNHEFSYNSTLFISNCLFEPIYFKPDPVLPEHP